MGNLHARVSYFEARDAYEIADLESANGTFVNGQRIEPHGPVELRAGDEIRLGRSFRMLFRPRLDGGKESCAALVCLDEEGRESDCFVIAPRERVVIGNGEGCVARIPPPLLAEGESLGTVEWTPGGIRFRGARDQGAGRGTLLEDGDEINLPRLTLRVKIPRKSDAGSPTPTVRYEPQGFVSGPTRVKEIKKPDPDELPPWIRKLDIALGGLALVVLPLIVYLLRPDPLDRRRRPLVQACHNQLISNEGEGWTRSRSKITWPPAGLIQPCVVAPVGSVKAYRIDEDRLLGDLPEGTYLDPSHFWSNRDTFLKKFENQSLLLVVFRESYFWEGHTFIEPNAKIGLTVEYYGRYKDGSGPDFAFTRVESKLDRQVPRLAAAALAAMAATGYLAPSPSSATAAAAWPSTKPGRRSGPRRLTS